MIAGIVAVILNLIIPDDQPELTNIVVSPSFEDPTLESGTHGTSMAVLSKGDGKKSALTDNEEEEYKARVEGHEGPRTTVMEA